MGFNKCESFNTYVGHLAKRYGLHGVFVCCAVETDKGLHFEGQAAGRCNEAMIKAGRAFDKELKRALAEEIQNGHIVEKIVDAQGCVLSDTGEGEEDNG